MYGTGFARALRVVIDKFDLMALADPVTATTGGDDEDFLWQICNQPVTKKTGFVRNIIFTVFQYLLEDPEYTVHFFTHQAEKYGSCGLDSYDNPPRNHSQAKQLQGD